MFIAGRGHVDDHISIELRSRCGIVGHVGHWAVLLYSVWKSRGGGGPRSFQSGKQTDDESYWSEMVMDREIGMDQEK